MTNPQGLHLVWADTGGVTDPTDVKYQTGWIAEIPTFQNFNYVLQGLDKAKLSYAESDSYPWQDFIAYQAGARVRAGNIVHTCITAHNDVTGSNPQNPVLDVTNSYWVAGTVYSGQADAYTNLLPKEGLKLDRIKSRTTTELWESNDLTILNKSALLALNVEGVTYDNLVFGNVRGKLMVYNAANVTDPNSVDLAADGWKIYHEGNKPTQSDVAGTIPDAPADGKAYTRRDNNWAVDEGVTTINAMTVSGVAIVGGTINQLQDSGNFTTPDAGSVDVNTIMYLELSEIHKNKTPTVTAFAGNLFRNSLGTDNVLNFIGPALVELVSNGVDEWAVFERAKDGLDGTDAATGVIPYTVNGILTAGGVNNQLRDSGTFTMPLANSVDVDSILVVELPDTYSAQTPSIIRGGTDFLEDKDSATHVDLNFLGAAKLTFTSDGVSTWSL